MFEIESNLSIHSIDYSSLSTLASENDNKLMIKDQVHLYRVDELIVVIEHVRYSNSNHSLLKIFGWIKIAFGKLFAGYFVEIDYPECEVSKKIMVEVY